MKTADVLPIVTSPSPSAVTPATSLNQPIIAPLKVSPGTSKSQNRMKANKMASKAMLSPSNYHNISPRADLKLPAEIFASDDSVSDAGMATTDEMVQNVLFQDSLLSTDPIVSAKDKMLGGINIKVEKTSENPKANKKSKKASNAAVPATLNLADIKTELQDDLDWNNMTLATVNNNSNVHSYSNV